MKRIIFVVFCICLTLEFVEAQEHAVEKKREKPEYLKNRESEVVELFEEVIPTSVVILTRRDVIDEEGRHQVENIGSGVLISEENHILTAAHVVNTADDIAVRTFDGEIRMAEVIFSEGSADIALIKLSTPVTGLKFAHLGNSDNLAVGQYIYVIGTPYGLENSFSVGHISGFREFDRLYDGTIRAEFIQTDAAINSGNSGGPVFNSQGEVIGIASRILSVSGGFQGLGFVVAINTAKQLLALEERIWMGMEGIFFDSSLLSLLLQHDLPGGVLIQNVSKGSPADKAGLRGGIISARINGQDFLLGGDLILELGDQQACHSECLVDAHRHLQGMDRIRVKYLRGGKILETTIDVSASRRKFID